MKRIALHNNRTLYIVWSRCLYFCTWCLNDASHSTNSTTSTSIWISLAGVLCDYFLGHLRLPLDADCVDWNQPQRGGYLGGCGDFAYVPHPRHLLLHRWQALRLPWQQVVVDSREYWNWHRWVGIEYNLHKCLAFVRSSRNSCREWLLMCEKLEMRASGFAMNTVDGIPRWSKSLRFRAREAGEGSCGITSKAPFGSWCCLLRLVWSFFWLSLLVLSKTAFPHAVCFVHSCVTLCTSHWLKKQMYDPTFSGTS